MAATRSRDELTPAGSSPGVVPSGARRTWVRLVPDPPPGRSGQRAAFRPAIPLLLLADAGGGARGWPAPIFGQRVSGGALGSETWGGFPGGGDDVGSGRPPLRARIRGRRIDMRAILSPAVALLIRLSNEQKLPLISALFVLPLAVLYHETGSH